MFDRFGMAAFHRPDKFLSLRRRNTLPNSLAGSPIPCGVVRDCDLVAKFKIAIFFPRVFVGADSRKCTLAKNSRYIYGSPHTLVLDEIPSHSTLVLDDSPHPSGVK